MTDGQPNADAMSFEDLLASPHLQFDVAGELLPHLLSFGPACGQVAGTVAAATAGSPALARRPWLFDPTAGTTTACA